MSHECRQGRLLELEILDFNASGDGVGRWGDWVIFVPDTVVGDRVLARLVRVKRRHALGKLQQLLEPSPHRTRPRCIVADKCGGCQWQHVDLACQRQAKRRQVIQALERLGGFFQPPVAPLLAAGPDLGYRNKATYPLRLSPEGKIQAGYYRRGSHRLVNLNQCPVQDPRLNPLLAEVKGDIQQRGWTIYDERCPQGGLRHLSLRIGRHTGEILLTLVTADWDLPGILDQAEAWLARYPQLVGVTLNYNPRRTNTIFGEQGRPVAGRPYLRERFAGLELHLGPETFFQVNTEAAEALLEVILERLALGGEERVVDAYCGIGTFTLPLGPRLQEAVGIEVNPASVAQARGNAEVNGIGNVTFISGTVEAVLPQISFTPDAILLDPPRQGCHATTLQILRELRPPKLVYISCQPATLARDLKLLCSGGLYRLAFVQPADFFPQTAHVESAAFLHLN